MAKNFNKAGSVQRINEVKKINDEKANVIQIRLISDEKLIDYHRNGEDISSTEDIELSIEQNGFTDPIEVTTFNRDDETYTIVSGHRRRIAGRNKGIKLFPCIVRKFNSESELYNAVLLANSQRDSSKDPLLYCKRYKMHEEYLKESNFKGSIREEIAKRLGISVQQADRYNQFNKIILSVWEMVREEKVGMSSVLPMATFNVEQQEEITSILIKNLNNGERLNREKVKKIIEEYKDGKNETEEAGNINTEPNESLVMDEQDDIKDISNNSTDFDSSLLELEEKKEVQDLTEEEKQFKNASNIIGTISKLNKYIGNSYKVEDVNKAEEMILSMGTLCEELIGEMYNVSRENKLLKDFEIIVEELKKAINKY